MSPPTTLAKLGFASVLAVCAHPDDESFGLGGLLLAFADIGTRTSLLCFTHGEASTLHAADGSLASVRSAELEAAAEVLGVSAWTLLSYPDAGLTTSPLEALCSEVAAAVIDAGADLLLTFDEGGVTGHPDHQRVTEATLASGERLGLPVLGWTLPVEAANTLNQEFATAFVGRLPSEIDLTITVDREGQRQAIDCHASQAIDNPVLWRRLALTGHRESVRWLRRPRR